MEAPLVQIAAPRPADATGWQARLERLEERLRALPAVVVAYSGGVDSSLLLRVATAVLGPRAIGVIGRSDSYAEDELRMALDQAAAFGAVVEVVSTGELADPNFRSNPANRCYFCKAELYRKLAAVAAARGAVVLDGTIADDLSDWRPGRQAASEHGVQSPLAELGFGKADVRAAARHLGITSSDKPASPCLASRIPYGTEITRDNLNQVEAGERVLREAGFRELRVRHHGDTARIEVPAADLGRVLAPGVRERVVAGLRAAGFRYVVLDLEGFRSGNLNDSILRTGVAGAAEREVRSGAGPGSSAGEPSPTSG